jgi:hypothetical protein
VRLRRRVARPPSRRLLAALQTQVTYEGSSSLIGTLNDGVSMPNNGSRPQAGRLLRRLSLIRGASPADFCQCDQLRRGGGPHSTHLRTTHTHTHTHAHTHSAGCRNLTCAAATERAVPIASRPEGSRGRPLRSRSPMLGLRAPEGYLFGCRQTPSSCLLVSAEPQPCRPYCPFTRPLRAAWGAFRRARS